MSYTPLVDGKQMQIKISEVITRTVDTMLLRQLPDGSFKHGHNGPYYDEELPIRNTSHVTMLLLKAHEITGAQKYRDAALRALSYITAEERRPMGATIWARKNPEKDFSNGLIGQAWVIEALAYAAEKLDDPSLNTLAEKVFLLHPFDEKTARWRIVNVDGSYAGVDMTFNHQLWFAAAGGSVADSEQIKNQIEIFLDKLGDNLKIYDTGLIVHALGGGNNRKSLRRAVKGFIKAKVKRQNKSELYKNSVINKAIGYHAFNTYAFALLFQEYSTHSFWRSDTFFRILSFLQTDLYREGLEWFCPTPQGRGKELPFNKFGYSYNPPGIEVAYTMQIFKSYYSEISDQTIGLWLGRQFSKTLNAESMLMDILTDDEMTLSARLYEAVRLEDYSV